MRKIICSALLPFILIFLTSVVTDAADSALHKLLQDAWARVDHVSVHDVSKMLDSKERIVLLDVRESVEYKNEHIPGAVNISRGMLEFMIEDRVPDKDTKIIVYWTFDNRSPLAASRLIDLGYTNAIVMKKGLTGWKKADYPVSTWKKWLPF